jgi:hypothetical protein
MPRFRITHIEIDDPNEAMVLAALGGLSAPVPQNVTVEVPIELPPAADPKRTPRKALPPTEKAGVEPRKGTITDRILDVLRRGPRSSLELTSLLHLEPQSVYSTCSLLKSKGLLESKTDDADGTRRWHVR